ACRAGSADRGGPSILEGSRLCGPRFSFLGIDRVSRAERPRECAWHAIRTLFSSGSMELTSRYLGFALPHPLMPGASPMVDDLDMVRRLEDAGASAIVMHSLFEEQIAAEEHATGQAGDVHSFGAVPGCMPGRPVFVLGPDRYLEQLRRIRQA